MVVITAMNPIQELLIQLPSPTAANSPRNRPLPPPPPRPTAEQEARAFSETASPLERIPLFEESHHATLRESYPHLHNPYRFCLEHFVIDSEKLVGDWLRHNDTIICNRLTQKTDHGLMIREPNDGWWRRVEEENEPHVWPGDAFLVRRDEREYEYFTEPARQLPADWVPCAGTSAQQRDERVRAHRTLNKDRAKATCVVTYDYITVYTKMGRWRRKMVAYERGTPSPFTFEYYDARNHHPLFQDQ
jgi:hypothetical protein